MAPVTTKTNASSAAAPRSAGHVWWKGDARSPANTATPDRRERGDGKQRPAAIPLDERHRHERPPPRDAAVLERTGAHQHSLDGRGGKNVAEPHGHEADPEGVGKGHVPAAVACEAAQHTPDEQVADDLERGRDGKPAGVRRGNAAQSAAQLSGDAVRSDSEGQCEQRTQEPSSHLFTGYPVS